MRRDEIIQMYNSLPDSKKQQVREMVEKIFEPKQSLSLQKVPEFLSGKRLYQRDLTELSLKMRQLAKKPLSRIIQGHGNLSARVAQFLTRPQLGHTASTSTRTNRTFNQSTMEKLAVVDTEKMDTTQFLKKLSKFKALQKLKLVVDRIEQKEMLFRELSSLQSLRELSLEISIDSAEELIRLGDCLGQLTKLERLCLEPILNVSDLSPKSVRLLSVSLSKLARLKSFELSSGGFENDDGEILDGLLLSCIEKMPLLEELIISDAADLDSDFYKTILSTRTHLRVLRLPIFFYDPIDDDMSNMIAIKCEALISLKNSLRDLTWHLGYEGGIDPSQTRIQEIVLGAFGQLTLLERLVFPVEGQFFIGADPGLITDTFSKLPRLKEVYTRFETPEQVQGLLKAFHVSNPTHLHTLSLRGSRIISITELCMSIPCLRKARERILTKIQSSPQQITQGFKLNLSNCAITGAQVRDFLKTFGSTLQYLPNVSIDLSNNSLSRSDLVAIKWFSEGGGAKIILS